MKTIRSVSLLSSTCPGSNCTCIEFCVADDYDTLLATMIEICKQINKVTNFIRFLVFKLVGIAHIRVETNITIHFKISI